MRVEVMGMACPFCAYNIEKRIKTLDGYEPDSYEAYVDKGLVTFEWKEDVPFDQAAVREQIRKSGFTPGGVRFAGADGETSEADAAENSGDDESDSQPISRERIAKALGVEAKRLPGGVVKAGWKRDEVPVEVDGMRLPPAAGLGSWASFKPVGDGKAIVMGDTVVFPDEVDAAMDAAIEHGLRITALHNHFFYDRPKVFFMHIGGHGPAAELAEGVRAVWDAIRTVRREHPEPRQRYPGEQPEPGGSIDADRIARITGLEPSEKPGGVMKITTGREGEAHGVKVGGAMGLGTWAAFVGSDRRASVDGDFIMKRGEVQPVIRALRKHEIHVVALHNHMIGERPPFYFLHFQAKGPAAELARGFRAALDAQKKARAE